METNVVLEARDIEKVYPGKDGGPSLQVLNGVSIAVEAGQIVSIVGASGSGKSTLLHILGGLDRPSAGAVRYGNTEITAFGVEELARFRNKNVGFVFQFHHLLPEFTALENVAMPSLIMKQPKKEAEARAIRLLDRFGLKERIHHRPAELSGGEQQRVAVARALINEPKILLADEPTGNLDDKNTANVLELLFELRHEYNLSMVIVTHDNEIARRSDRRYEIHGGSLFTRN